MFLFIILCLFIFHGYLISHYYKNKMYSYMLTWEKVNTIIYWTATLTLCMPNLILFLLASISSHTSFSWRRCPGDSGNFSGEIPIGIPFSPSLSCSSGNTSSVFSRNKSPGIGVALAILRIKKWKLILKMSQGFFLNWQYCPLCLRCRVMALTHPLLKEEELAA